VADDYDYTQHSDASSLRRPSVRSQEAMEAALAAQDAEVERAEAAAPQKAQNAAKPASPAGWYADPRMVDTQRYWDGAKWTEHVAPRAAPFAPAHIVAQPPEDRSGMIVAGYVLAVLFPIGGVVIGLVLPTRYAGHKAGIILLSLGAMVVYFNLITASAEPPPLR